jgi:hypothetical protein
MELGRHNLLLPSSSVWLGSSGHGACQVRGPFAGYSPVMFICSGLVERDQEEDDDDDESWALLG